jgi:hypothetical protein
MKKSYIVIQRVINSLEDIQYNVDENESDASRIYEKID